MVALVLSLLLVTGTGTYLGMFSTANEVKSEGKEHVLGYHTGCLGTDWYDGAFSRKATQLCPDGYTIKSKSDHYPDSNYGYFWTIDCK